MDKQTIVTINGRSYDAVTGLPVEAAKPAAPKPKPAPAPAPVHDVNHAGAAATSVHKTTQRSRTLNRRTTKKSVATNSANRPPAGHTMDISRSSRISHFAARPTATKPQPKATADLPATPHPTVKKITENRRPAVAAAKIMSPAETKKAVIAEALSKPAAVPTQTSFVSRHRRLVIIVASAIGVLIIAGVLYLSLPSLSVTVAGGLAGVSANYPGDIPDGYGMNGPATYTSGKVTLRFKAGAGNAEFTLNEAKSSWDSSAVLANIVVEQAGSNYLTTEASGLTIYTYGSNAAWVNGGVLYTISGNAPLSTDQISQLATSL